MGSVSKLYKFCNEDRISDLHDSILIHILSFLPTKTAVRTSKLSKRWKTLYILLPNLDFRESRIIDDFECRGYLQKMSFMNFVDRFFRLRPHDLNLERFTLKCFQDYKVDNVDEWIRYAIRHNVKEISLSLSFEGYRLTPELYMCRSIEVLQLVDHNLADAPENIVGFPRLKILIFKGVEFVSSEWVEKLLLSCPVLEELTIDNCEWLEGNCLTVCGSSLRKLVYNCMKRVDLILDTPALEIFQIGEIMCKELLIKRNLEALTTASIDIRPNMDWDVPDSLTGDSVFEFLSKISHVKSLTFYDLALEVLSDASEYSFPTFHNLTRLKLAWSGWSLLPNILASSPKLQHLVFPDDDVYTLQGHYFTRSLTKHDPNCLSSHLKTIQLGHFEGTEAELSLVEYFFKHGKTLEKMSIRCCISEKSIMEKLLNLCRAATTCKVDIHNIYDE